MIARFSAEEVRQRRGDDHVHTVATCAEEQEIFVYADSIEKGFLLLQRTTNQVFDFLPRVQLQDIGDQNEKMWEIYRDNLKAGHIRSPDPIEDAGAPSVSMLIEGAPPTTSSPGTPVGRSILRTKSDASALPAALDADGRSARILESERSDLPVSCRALPATSVCGSLESGDLWYRSRLSITNICSSSGGWWVEDATRFVELSDQMALHVMSPYS